jgi:hypothetical protein
MSEEGGDLLGGHRVAVLLRAQSPHTHGSGPTLPREAQLGDPGIGPASDDGLTSRMARGVVIHAAFGARLSIATRPDTRIYGINWLTLNQGPGDKRMLKRAAVDLADRQRVIQTAPSALMLRLDAEQRQRGDGSSRQQRVTQLEQGIPPTPKGGISRSTKGRERGKGSGFHIPYCVTLCRSPVPPQIPLRG